MKALVSTIRALRPPAAPHSPWTALALVALLLCWPALSGAAGETLRQAWDGHRERGAAAGLPEALEIRSREGAVEVSAEVLGVLPFPFETVAASLAEPADWCDFVPLHFNIKACAYGLDAGEPFLVLYSGRKGYGAAEDAYRFDYGFTPRSVEGAYVEVDLLAERGPLSTRDHRLRVEAIPVGDGTFIRFASSYAQSPISRAGTALYLGTLGRSKVGFTREAPLEPEAPAPVRGVRGIVERNGVRYYLALKAFLENRNGADEGRFEEGLRTWFDLAAQYPELYETSWEAYRETKRRERENQRQLQGALEKGGLSALPGTR